LPDRADRMFLEPFRQWIKDVSSDRVTELLRAWSGGDEEALAILTPLVHLELRRMARRCMRGERRDHTLQATGLVNECYLRLVDARRVEWRDRSHFFTLSARLMRRILVDLARERQAAKRGAGAVHVTSRDPQPMLRPDRILVALDDALSTLAALDERKGRVVEMRFFGGLDTEEIAGALGISAKTVLRDWQLAKAWLRRELGPTATGNDAASEVALP
jgi:RNA polymerase sigma factor (TIGR02999 family)